MEKRFTFRFFDISREDNNIPPLADMFRQIADIENMKAREKKLAEDYTVRLENLQDDGSDAVVGEFTRCQRTNFPSEISNSTRKTLEAEELGHSVVFRLNHKTGAFGIQYDNRVMSPGRVLSYVSEFNPKAKYNMLPVLNQKAWEKFNNGVPRKIIVKVANPKNLELAEGHGRSVSESLKSMGDAYEAPFVLLELSMGNRKGKLENVKTMVRDFMKTGGDIVKLSGTAIVDDTTQEFDLLEERLKVVETLPIDDRDPIKNWEIKREFICINMKSIGL